MNEQSVDLRPELKDCVTRVLQLPSEERAFLAERLIASLDSLDESENERLWVREAEARYQAYKEGRISSRPADEVLRDARESIQ